MGIGGAIYAHMIGFISPPNFTLTISLLIISIVLLGGSDNIIGVLVGAFILVLIPEKLRVITEYRVMLYGLLIVLILIFRPKGLIPFKERIYDKVIAKEN
jgi:branched-chain amino acid transport system permease protein